MPDHSSWQKEWSDALDRFGMVEFRRSRRTAAVFLLISLAFVSVGIVMVKTDEDTATLVNGTIVAAIFSIAAVVFLTMLLHKRVVLTVRRDGLHIPVLRPLDIPWEHVIDVAVYKFNRASPKSLAIFVWPAVLEEYRKTLPRVLQMMARVLPKSAQWRLFVPIQMLAVPCDEFAGWINTQVDGRAAVPSQLCLVPGEGRSPVWGLPNQRPVELTKLRISTGLQDQLTSWARRAALPFEREMDGKDPGANWADLRAEGRRLSTRVGHELGVAHTVIWWGEHADSR